MMIFRFWYFCRKKENDFFYQDFILFSIYTIADKILLIILIKLLFLTNNIVLIVIIFTGCLAVENTEF